MESSGIDSECSVWMSEACALLLNAKKHQDLNLKEVEVELYATQMPLNAPM